MRLLVWRFFQNPTGIRSDAVNMEDILKERWNMYDVMIIGSGVSGSAAARELSRYKAKICVLEKEEDVCCGTSKANSGIVHAGYDAKEGSLLAK